MKKLAQKTQYWHILNRSPQWSSWCLLALSLVLLACGEPEAKVGDEKNDEKTATTQPANKQGTPPAKAEQPASSEQSAHPVQVVSLQKQTVTFTQDLPGRISAYRRAEVRARVNGIVEKRLFTEGSDVSENSALFQIEDDILRANVNAAQADVSSANAAYELAKLTANRYERLLKQNAVSKQERDTAAAQVKQAKAKVEQGKAYLAQQQIYLDYSAVRAPISGRIGKALVTEGALASATSSTPLGIIEQIEQVYIDFTRPHNEVVQLEKLMQNRAIKEKSTPSVEVLWDDGGIYPEKGQLTFSDLAIDEATGAVALRALVGNPNKALLPGMYVRVRLPVAELDDVIAIPQQALQTGPAGAFVFTVVDNKLVSTPVKLGKLAGQDWVVDAGLKAGDQVVVSMVLGAQAGMAVKVVPADAKPTGAADSAAPESGKKPVIDTDKSTDSAAKTEKRGE